MNTYEQTLAPGAVWVLDSPGDLVRLLDSSAGLDIQITRAGMPMKEAKNILAGFWAKPRGGFSGIRIINGGTAQTVKVGISEGEAGYDRLQISGGVVFQQGTAITDLAPVSVGVSSTQLCAPDSARESVRFYNAGTVDVYIGGIGVTTSNGAIKLAPGATWIERDGSPAAWYGVAGTAGQSVRVQTVS